MKDSLILIDEEPLSETFIPTRLFHREGQLKEILTDIRPALHGKEARNVLVTGNTGTGKTSLIRWILKEHFEKKHAYVNCLNCRSEHKILENILIQLGHVVPENKPTDYLAQKFAKLVGRNAIVCLDEVDQTKDNRILQTLSIQQCALILISNRRFFFDALEDRLRTRLFLAEVEFPKYAKSELVGILKDRTQFAVSPYDVELSVDVESFRSRERRRLALLH
jgi:cell division control protein 6